ncbi:uncharacterized protein SETTUDRAFT_139992 [Exserohilum turcica Et28A]|uniref:Uncharacterized protein n=1 Tax=Exserohilum turcicum (strain 28A) TaxID=671987 RepID=R0K501_EXST2|nr:uncharacterized protein SETTUDRAFT_139992 [Exserohilum turcica Et28A]EOA83437.1 hypothetical protein SETTUDRAFT_139992 [Exserohilum turcica Et28A]
MSATAQLVFDWIAAHPIQTCVFMASTIVLVRPRVATVPIFAAIGLTTLGPAGGSFAAWVMSYFGFVQAGGWYAVAQSAAMGGYGAPVAYGVAQAGALLSSGIAWALGRNDTAT